MYLLIDTAFDICQAGLWHDGALHAFLSMPGEARHDVVLAPLVEQLLFDKNLSVSQLKGVAVTTGPGRFTSLRVGIALARALVLPKQIPLVGVATGHILQTALPAEQAGWLVMVKRGEVFAQTPTMTEPVILSFDQVAAWLKEYSISHLAVIGAGVPTDWSTFLPSGLKTYIMTTLSLPALGQAADRLFANYTSQPVRPYYGSSTGAWDKTVSS